MVAGLWNDRALDEQYQGDHLALQQALLEQYKLYVEMADRISQRRGQMNTFFLSLNSAVFVLIGVFWDSPPGLDPLWLVFPLVAALGQCFGWFYLLRSFRQLNTAKYAVIGELEERLPSSPYYRAEWAALGEGKDPRRYWPLSHIEQFVPSLFAVIYVAGFLTAVLA